MDTPKRLVVVVLAVATLILTHSAHVAAQDCGAPCRDDAVCAREQALCFMAEQNHDVAVELLKEAHAAHPKDSQLPKLLAWAYLETGNRIWAMKTLLSYLERSPQDLDARTWVVWLLIRNGDLARAERQLEQIEVPKQGPMLERIELLRTTISKLRRRDEQAAESLQKLEERDGELYPEDVALFSDLRSQLRGVRGDPLQARVVVAGGYATNAIQSAPQDVGANLSKAGSPITSADLVLRFEPWISAQARPLGEIRSKLFVPMTDDARGLGYLNLAGRLGGEIGRVDAMRVRLLYSYELLRLWDKGWYMDAHRGEVELDLRPWFQVFGGVGRRVYEHLPRTRTELDTGIAVQFPLAGGWNLTGIAAGRAQFARHDAFDGRGLTGLARVKVPLPGSVMIKLRVMGLFDAFPHSKDYYGTSEHRRDLMVKTEAGPWTPSFHGFRLGGTYNLAHRVSNIDTITDNFNFTDHRFLLQLRWQGSFDPALPRKSSVSEAHIPLPYGLARDGDSGLDRVQDLLRQEDSARRGSMCVD